MDKIEFSKIVRDFCRQSMKMDKIRTEIDGMQIDIIGRSSEVDNIYPDVSTAKGIYEEITPKKMDGLIDHLWDDKNSFGSNTLIYGMDRRHENVEFFYENGVIQKNNWH